MNVTQICKVAARAKCPQVVGRRKDLRDSQCHPPLPNAGRGLRCCTARTGSWQRTVPPRHQVTQCPMSISRVPFRAGRGPSGILANAIQNWRLRSNKIILGRTFITHGVSLRTCGADKLGPSPRLTVPSSAFPDRAANTPGLSGRKVLHGTKCPSPFSGGSGNQVSAWPRPSALGCAASQESMVLRPCQLEDKCCS